MPLPIASKIWANYPAGWKSGEAYVDPLAAYLVYDTFTGANGTHIHDHVPEKAPTGAAWADADGVAGWTIASNKAVVSTAPGEQSVKIDCGAADVSVKVAKFTVGTYTSILARGTAGALNGILFYIESAEDRIEIGKYDAGFSQLGTAALVCAPGDVFDNVELRCSGTTITALIDGVQQLQVTSTFNQTQTHVGLLSYSDTGPNGAASDFAVAAI